MKLILILNGTSKKQERFRKYYQSRLPALDIKLTTYAGHAEELAQHAANELPDGILAGGGDGTLSQVINGVLKSNHPSTPVGIIPLGTANDFAAMCGIRKPSDVSKCLNLLPQPTDVGLVKGADGEERYFINCASLGMGPDVVRRLERDSRKFGPGLTYLKAIVGSFFGHIPEGISAESDEWKWAGQIRSMAISNGKSFGNRLYIAPEASHNDGVLDTFIAGDVSLLTFLRLLARVRMGNRANHPKVAYNICRTIKLSSAKETWLEADGELVFKLPVEIKMMPGKLNFFR